MIFLFAWCIIVIGCRVADRASDVEKSMVHRHDSAQVKTASHEQENIRYSQIHSNGNVFIMDKIRTPFRQGETLDQYAAENSHKIIQYDFGRKSSDSEKSASKYTAAVTVGTADSIGSKKITDHKTKSAFAVPWYAWVIAAAITGGLGYLKFK